MGFQPFRVAQELIKDNTVILDDNSRMRGARFVMDGF
jgi:hypothetical protein